MAAVLADVLTLADVELTVLDNMRLLISPQDIGRAGEHNSALFRIVQQPAELEALPCRAEIRAADGSTFYIAVTDGEFLLTSDIAVHGTGNLQLVWSDGTVTHKTLIAQYYINQSVFAVDPSDPEYQDGLATITAAAFTDAETDGNTLIFRNLAGGIVDSVAFPGAGLDEQQAERLFLRLNGQNQMDGNIAIQGRNRGIVFDMNETAAAIYETAGSVLALRRPAGNADVVIEDNAGQNASPILTETMGNQRYLSAAMADQMYLRIDGGIITGPINTAYESNNPAISALVTRLYVDQQDARLLPLSGGVLTGILGFAPGVPLISAMGNGNNPMLCIGSNDTGFWRTGGNVVLEIGYAPVWIWGAGGMTSYANITLPGAPVNPSHAATKAYVDGVAAPRAQPMTIFRGATSPITGTFSEIVSIPYSIPRGGLSTVQVTVNVGLRFAAASTLGMVQMRASPGTKVVNAFTYSIPGEPGTVETAGVEATFFVEVNGTAPLITTEIRLLGQTPALDMIGGPSEPQRTMVTFADLGPRSVEVSDAA